MSYALRGGVVMNEELAHDLSILEATLDSVTDGILAVDRNRRVLRYNERFATMWSLPGELGPGSSSDKVLEHMTTQMLDPASYRARVRELRARPDGHGRAEVCLCDGRIIEQRSRPMLIAGEPRGRVICYRDVTIARAAEIALRRSEEQLRQLFEAAPDGIAVARATRVVFANRAFARLLGHPEPTVVIGAKIGEIVADGDRDDLVSRVDQSHSGTMPSSLRERRFVRADGSLIHVEVSALPVMFDGGPSMLLVVRDVTERKRLQSQLLLADRMASLGALAAGVAHEINNPLGYAIGNLDVIARTLSAAARDLAAIRTQRAAGVAATDEGHISAAAARVEEAIAMQRTASEGCRRVRMIVGDLKTFSRADEDTSRLVDVRWALDSVLNIAKSEIEKRARLVKDYEEVPLVRANESRLGQVFLNLLVNAAQAIPAGDPENNEVRVTTGSSLEGRAIVQIADTGAGIPVEALPRVFDPFFTTKPPGEGTGLGLSICQQIVAQLGGTIEVSSSREVGTTFRITL